MLVEQFKPINGYEGKYSVSNKGRVYSHVHKGRFLKPASTGTGYLAVSLWKDSKGHTLKVHRLVALHFVDGYEEGLTVNHIDEDSSNNEASNLEWLTQMDNYLHSIDKIQAAIRASTHTYNVKGYLLTSSCGDVKEVYNLNAFCRDNNLDQSAMYKVMSGKYKQHKGFTCKPITI